MQIEGYARLIVDTTGRKYVIEDVWINDDRLDVDWDLLKEQLGDQLPLDIIDAQILCWFGYHCEEIYVRDYACYEYEDIFPLIDYVVINQNYKNKWKDRVHRLMKYAEPLDYIINGNKLIINPESFLAEEVEKWEFLYDEDFPIPPKENAHQKKIEGEWVEFK